MMNRVKKGRLGKFVLKQVAAAMALCLTVSMAGLFVVAPYVPWYDLADYLLTDPTKAESSASVAGIEGFYPSYGSVCETLTIPCMNLKAEVVFGDEFSLLQQHIGHNTGSYFPGKGGSVVLVGLNTKDFFGRLSRMEVGDFAYLTTSYGEFTYRVTKTDVITLTNVEFADYPISEDAEQLMLCTFYPFDQTGLTYQRYVVYAELYRTVLTSEGAAS